MTNIEYFDIIRVHVNNKHIGNICELHSGDYGFFDNDSQSSLPSQVSRTSKELKERIDYMYQD